MDSVCKSTAGGSLVATAVDRALRWAIAGEVAAALMDAHGDEFVAVGVYGSTARGEDQAYSDLEMMALVRGNTPHRVDEWLERGLKIKLHRYTPDAALDAARTVGVEHCLERSRYQHLRLVVGDAVAFDALRRVASNPDPEQVESALRRILLGELFELECKMLNAGTASDALVLWALRCSEFGALALGLASNSLVPSWGSLLACSLDMPRCPERHRELVRSVLTGSLSPTPELFVLVLATIREWLAWAHLIGLDVESWSRRPSDLKGKH